MIPLGILAGGAAGYIDQVVKDGAIALWLLNETSGTTATDSIGVRNLTYRNSPTLNVAGPGTKDLSAAATFNGTNENAFGANSTTFTTRASDAWSIEVWVKWTNTSSNRFAFVVRNSDATEARVTGMLFVNRGGFPGEIGLRSVTDGGFGFTINSTNTFNDGNWHHLAGTAAAGGAMRIYVDGVLQAFSTQLRNTASAQRSITVASNRTGSTSYVDYFPGSVAACAYYPLELTAAQVAKHYDLGTK
jgi:trimeric autotransporter adhesin